jgi:hypothetical protein
LTQPVEKLRQIWTPGREVEEITANLEPGSDLDSQIRDLLHRIIQQRGPVTLDLEVKNVGNLRWEVIAHGLTGRQEISIWVE